MHSEYKMTVKGFMGWADSPKNCGDHERDEQVDALVAEEGRQRFGVGPHLA
jgi:hypothetical protein